jgi:hypothetical protein
MKLRRSPKATPAKKKPRRAKAAAQPKKNTGFVALALSGAVVPRGYDVHKNNYGQNLLHGQVTVRATAEKRVACLESPKSLAKLPAGSVGKRQATWAEAKAIAAGVRVGADVSKLVAEVLLTEDQREIIREANRAQARRFHSSKRKSKRRRNRAAEDIYRRGIRMPGSFQSRA